MQDDPFSSSDGLVLSVERPLPGWTYAKRIPPPSSCNSNFGGSDLAGPPVSHYPQKTQIKDFLKRYDFFVHFFRASGHFSTKVGWPKKESWSKAAYQKGWLWHVRNINHAQRATSCSTAYLLYRYLKRNERRGNKRLTRGKIKNLLKPHEKSSHVQTAAKV